MKRISLAAVLGLVTCFAVVLSLLSRMEVHEPVVSYKPYIVDLLLHDTKKQLSVLNTQSRRPLHLWTHSASVDQFKGAYSIDIRLANGPWLHWTKIEKAVSNSVAIVDSVFGQNDFDDPLRREVHLIHRQKILSIRGLNDGTGGSAGFRLQPKVGDYVIIYDQSIIDAEIVFGPPLPVCSYKANRQLNDTGTIPNASELLRVRILRIE